MKRILIVPFLVLFMASSVYAEVSVCPHRNEEGKEDFKQFCVPTEFFVKKGDVLEEVLSERVYPFKNINKQEELDKKGYVRMNALFLADTGDTFYICTNGGDLSLSLPIKERYHCHDVVKVYIAGLDAPKGKQPYAKESEKKVCGLFEKVYTLSSTGKKVTDYVGNKGEALVITGEMPVNADGDVETLTSTAIKKGYAGSDAGTGGFGDSFRGGFAHGGKEGMWAIPHMVHPKDWRNKPTMSKSD
jgi:hypothetical protein